MHHGHVASCPRQKPAEELLILLRACCAAFVWRTNLVLQQGAAGLQAERFVPVGLQDGIVNGLHNAISDDGVCWIRYRGSSGTGT